MLLSVENENHRYDSCGMWGVDKRCGLQLAWSWSPLVDTVDRQMISSEELFTPPAPDSARLIENTEPPDVLVRKTEERSNIVVKVA